MEIKKLTNVRLIKTILENTNEHLSDIDEKIKCNNDYLHGLLEDMIKNECLCFKSIKNKLKEIIDNNNKILSENILFKSVEIINIEENDGN